ncbi:TonB-dependent receptor plug domain-containing protein [Chryseobacterium vrystaatense]|uniref:Outer membrane receptor for ferrienterochelin and colicins n=1 Tax=Chryseobacterium vrystaatense TaxID=307480 RepID=A0A1M5BA12_9FLAO|nr:TonB-dependent receptor [Chryseobacterium vrystaatense]SHF39329.1 outer membrane receptor for ferrienterochelin and colicins [Chryseobacterium vrystaatense]
MKKKVLSVLSLSIAFWMNAQEKDSLNKNKIEEVVITGQYTQQSINKSIYKVEVIDAEQIKNMAATNAADVLNQTLNIQITPNTNSGNSTANIMGLGGNYVKILIDNIPVVGDTGLGSNIDLTKISLSNIERIEIVKGSMGVEYGNGALAGVINIITKKNSSKKLSIRAAVQEETVRDGYNIKKKGKGRHIQNLNVGYNLDDHWFTNISFNHNQFMGYEGEKAGYKYFGEKQIRGYEWNPKDQYEATALVRYTKDKTSFFYKVSYLNEKFNFYNPVSIREPLNDGQGGATYLASDREYNTNRWLHQFNIQTNLGHIRYMGDFSYQKQDRKFFDYSYDIPNRTTLSEKPENSYYKTDVIYSRGMFSNFLDSKKFDFQLGYELDYTNGYASLIAGDFFEKSLKRKIFTYGTFLSAEWNVSDKFSLRPGARLSVSENFDNQFNYSLSARLKTSENSNLRGVFGTANRYPTYDELYTYFVNLNHDIQGNPDLKPENGYSLGVFWDQGFSIGDGWKFNYNLEALYVDLKDKIEMVMIQRPSTYKYMNIDQYRSLLFGANANIVKDQFTFGLRTSLNGISVSKQDMDIKSPTDFQYNFQAGANVSYKLKNINTGFNLYYKYTGPSRLYVLEADGFQLGKNDGFHMMDFIVSQPFWKDRLELSVGVKNIFDVTSINSSTNAGNAHTAGSDRLNLYYGRSYFARLMYQF